MGMTVVFANQKGGVGKTTTAVNLGAYLAEQGKRVLLIDFDPQANLTSAVGADGGQPGAYEAITAGTPMSQLIRSTSVDNLHVISSSINLTGANVELVDQEDRAFFLRRATESVKNQFDFIFIDSPPSLGILTLNGLVAADQVFIPLQCEYFAMEGLTQLLQSIKRVQDGLNRDLKIMGIGEKTATELIREFGKEYEVYKKKVPMLLPRIRSKSK